MNTTENKINTFLIPLSIIVEIILNILQITKYLNPVIYLFASISLIVLLIFLFNCTLKKYKKEIIQLDNQYKNLNKQYEDLTQEYTNTKYLMNNITLNYNGLIN